MSISRLLNLGFEFHLTVWFLLLFSCSDGSDEGDVDVECIANVDCAGTGACVEGVCIGDPAECSVVGAFVEVSEAAPQNADQVSELHVAIDRGGATHYCYHGIKDGKPVSYYGRQVRWDSFVEESLRTAEAASLRCGAITVTPEGAPYILSRDPPAVLSRDDDGNWAAVELEDLVGLEARGALRGSRTLITLTPDDQGGVYLGLSLGYKLGLQPIYLAHVIGQTLDILLNGWSESGDPSATGHAPQFLVRGDAVDMVMGRMLGFNILLTDTKLKVAADTDGIYPRVATGSNGASMIVYADRNHQLHLDKINQWSFESIASLGEIGLPDNNEGQIPWEIAVDSFGTSHLLIEDETQGKNSLTYRAIDSAGSATSPELLTEDLAEDLPGMQRYAAGTDLCGRATFSMIVVSFNSIEQTVSKGLPVLRILEGR